MGGNRQKPVRFAESREQRRGGFPKARKKTESQKRARGSAKKRRQEGAEKSTMEHKTRPAKTAKQDERKRPGERKAGRS